MNIISSDLMMSAAVAQQQQGGSGGVHEETFKRSLQCALNKLGGVHYSSNR